MRLIPGALQAVRGWILCQRRCKDGTIGGPIRGETLAGEYQESYHFPGCPEPWEPQATGTGSRGTKPTSSLVKGHSKVHSPIRKCIGPAEELNGSPPDKTLCCQPWTAFTTANLLFIPAQAGLKQANKQNITKTNQPTKNTQPLPPEAKAANQRTGCSRCKRPLDYPSSPSKACSV